MKYRQLIGSKNLTLAWRRILTSTGIQYKNIYRSLYESHEAGIDATIDRLHEKLKGGWKPTHPHRVFLPKPSGLHRPIALMALEDQIVLQAVANAFAQKLRARRKAVENRSVFSNVLNTPSNSIFFVRNWKQTYYRYLFRCVHYYQHNLNWVVHFDLAAFYDTISHELLIKRVSPRGGNSGTWERVRGWLERWTVEAGSDMYHHGIPQGPIASDFLAECAMLPLDENMLRARYNYVRYVDDVRIFAQSEPQARTAAAKLEVQCRNLGLIPHSSKFAIREIASLSEFLELLPSIPPADFDASRARSSMDREEAENLFRGALGGRPLRVTDKSRLRFSLYRAPASRKILGRVALLLDRHPEHIDAFRFFGRQFDSSKPMERRICQVLRAGIPSAYVRGELWKWLAQIASDENIAQMRPLAMAELKQARDKLTFAAGVLEFLLIAQRNGYGRVAHRLKTQHSLVQAWCVPVLPESEYEPGKAVETILRSQRGDPGVMLAKELVKRSLSHVSYNIRPRDLAPAVHNVFSGVGLIYRRNVPRIDQIAEIIDERYGTVSKGVWRPLLGAEYAHVLQILLQAESVFHSGRSTWLLFQNSFNHAVLNSFVMFLDSKGLPGATSLTGRDGRLVKFGVLLQDGAPFSRAHPGIARPFRTMNSRRNSLPAAHPYDERGGRQNEFLRRSEQRIMGEGLRSAYGELTALVQDDL